MTGQSQGETNRDVRRSWLLVPLSDEEQVGRCWSFGADVVALDLAEFVADEERPRARERAREAIGVAARGGAHVFVQVDKDLLYADLRACVWPGLDGITIARLESPQEIVEADGLLSQLEEERGLLPGTLQIVASVETAKGNLAAMDIARSSSRLWGITLGRADLVMDLRPEPSGEIHLMTYLIQRMIIVANASGLTPVGAWWRSPARGLLASPDDSYQAALRGRRIGFRGSLCVRTEQVEPLNRGFTPESVEVEQAKQLFDRFNEVQGTGSGTFLQGDRIVDLPTAEGARQLISYSHACAARDEEKARAAEQAVQAASHQEERR